MFGKDIEGNGSEELYLQMEPLDCTFSEPLEMNKHLKPFYGYLIGQMDSSLRYGGLDSSYSRGILCKSCILNLSQ